MNLFSVADQLALNFVHKRIIGGVKGFIASGGNPLAAAGGFLRGGGATEAVQLPVRRTAPRTLTARPGLISAGEKEGGRVVKFPSFAPRAPSGPCGPGRFRVAGVCVDPGAAAPGGPPLFQMLGPGSGAGSVAPVGDAVMGRYGAGLVPGSRIVDRATCLRGMQLGNDGLCYNKGQIKNSERMWPRGRRPLLTGGDMRAISVASRAANRLTRTAVRLQEIGLIKKPVTRKPRKKSAH